VGALTAVATVDPNRPRSGAHVIAMVLCLPSMVLGLPVLYVVASTAFDLTHADDGGTTWPVTVSYVAVVVGTAMVNAVVVSAWLRRRRPRPTTAPSTSWAAGSARRP